MMNNLLFRCFAYSIILLLFATSTAISSDSTTPRQSVTEDVPQILNMAREARDYEVLSTYMRELADIGDEQAAAAFMEIFKTKVLPLKLRQTRFIALVSEFKLENGETKEELVSLLQGMLENKPDRLNTILISGALATFGDRHSMEYLLNEYRRSKSILTRQEEHFREYIFEELCQINQAEASQFVVEEVQQRNNFMLTLSAIGFMLEANNPYALEVARKCIHIKSEHFDLIEAQHYLRAIIKFGDIRDKEFLDHLREYLERFSNELVKEDLRPLMTQAYESIKNRSE